MFAQDFLYTGAAMLNILGSIIGVLGTVALTLIVLITALASLLKVMTDHDYFEEERPC